MSTESNNKKARLTLRIESKDGSVIERVIEGVEAIEFILGNAGILDDEIAAVLGCRWFIPRRISRYTREFAEM